jgi:hypothetical protein
MNPIIAKHLARRVAAQLKRDYAKAQLRKLWGK